MLARYAGAVPGDDAIRARYGDPTSSGGRPVAVGWLHQGRVTSPRGGHWSVIVGLQGDHFLMHDPAGEPLLVSGGHIRGSSGRGRRCSWLNFLPRWGSEGPRTGWYLTCSR